MKIKESNSSRVILWVFIIVGSLCALTGLTLGIVNAVDSKNYISTQATISYLDTYTNSDGDTSHIVKVDFEFDGQQYSDVELNFWSSDMYVGQEITILCHKENPLIIKSSLIAILVPCVVTGFGLLFFVITLFPLKKELKIRKNAKIAKEQGELVLCKIVNIITDKSYRVNGRYVNNIIECEAINDSVTSTYKSAPFSKKYFVEIGSTINVYRNREDSSKYYVDLNSIQPPQITFDYSLNSDIAVDNTDVYYNND